MKRMIPALAATAGVLGAMLTGIGPASAAVPPVDCSAGAYPRVLESSIPTNLQRPAVDGRAYNLAVGLVYTFEICVDIPDTSTLDIEIRIWGGDGSTRLFVDSRPGDKVFRYSAGPNGAWQVWGTMTGPGSTYIDYTWNEKQIPA